jgi:hypothetical protein
VELGQVPRIRIASAEKDAKLHHSQHEVAAEKEDARMEIK